MRLNVFVGYGSHLAGNSFRCVMARGLESKQLATPKNPFALCFTGAMRCGARGSTFKSLDEKLHAAVRNFDTVDLVRTFQCLS